MAMELAKTALSAAFAVAKPFAKEAIKGAIETGAEMGVQALARKFDPTYRGSKASTPSNLYRSQSSSPPGGEARVGNRRRRPSDAEPPPHSTPEAGTPGSESSTPASDVSSMSSWSNTPSTAGTTPSSSGTPSSEADRGERNHGPGVDPHLLTKKLEAVASNQADAAARQQIKDRLEGEIGERPDLYHDLAPGLVDKIADILSDAQSGKITDSEAREKMNGLHKEEAIGAVKQLAAKTAFENLVKLAMEMISSIGKIINESRTKMSLQGQ